MIEGGLDSLDLLQDVLSVLPSESSFQLPDLFLVHGNDTDPESQIDFVGKVPLESRVQLNSSSSFRRVVRRGTPFLLYTIHIEESVRAIYVSSMPYSRCFASHVFSVFQLTIVEDFRWKLGDEGVHSVLDTDLSASLN